MDGSNISIIDRVASSAWSAEDTDWNAIAPVSTINFVDVCSEGLGVSKEAFFFPLLSAAAAMIGRSATISLNHFWPEPPIVWTAVLADDKCRKKTAIQRFIVSSMKEAMDHIISEHAQQLFLTDTQDNVITSLPTIIQLSDSEFNAEKLASCCREGSRESFLFSKDLRRVYTPLQSEAGTSDDKPTQRSDRNQEYFFELQNSGQSPWTDEDGAVFSPVRFNLTGFIHPDEVIRLINSGGTSSGFLYSTVAIVPSKSGKVYHSKPHGTTAPLLTPVLLKLRQDHRLTRAYSLDDEAHSAFASYYNDVEDRLDRMSSGDSITRHVLSKSQGHVARLALVLHCLDHVTKVVCGPEQMVQKFESGEVIPETISARTMYHAINLMKMCIRGKNELLKWAAVVAKSQSEMPRGILGDSQSSPVKDARDRQSSSPKLGAEVQVLDAPGEMQQGTSEKIHSASPRVVQRRVGETLPATSTHSRSSLQPIAPAAAPPQNNVQLIRATVPVVPVNTQTSQVQRYPVAVNVNSGGPKIIQVSYTPQGTSLPVNAQPQVSSLVPLNRIASAQPTRIAPSRPAIAPRPKPSSSIPPRPASRMTPTVTKSLGRKVAKKHFAQAPTTTFLPTSSDYKNFLEICPSKARRLLVQGMNSLEAVWVAQRKLIPPIIDPTGGASGRRCYKYPTNAARAYLTALAEAGLGEMVSRNGGRSGKSTFRKRKYQDLTPAALEVLDKLNITKQQYSYVRNFMYSST